MEKCSSPAKILGRKNAFCSSVPYTFKAGPTVLRVTNGRGTPARLASSKKMSCSSGV